jgi:hypothetical protein
LWWRDIILWFSIMHRGVDRRGRHFGCLWNFRCSEDVRSWWMVVDIKC